MPDWAEFVHFERIPERSALHDFHIEPHVHPALIQLLFVTAGATGEAFTDGVRWTIEAPCVIVIPARTVHGFEFARDIDGAVVTAAQHPLESLAAAAAPELLPLLRRPAVLRVPADHRQAEALMPLFEAIGREARAHAPGRMSAGMSLLVALFVQVARIAAADAADGATRSRKAAQIERLRTLIDERFREHRPIESYAQALGLSGSQLGRLCRDVLGRSPLDLVNARLIHEAQRDLVYSTLSVKQVAGRLGFEDEAYFGRFFRKQTGQRPTEFRDMARRRLAPENA